MDGASVVAQPNAHCDGRRALRNYNGNEAAIALRLAAKWDLFRSVRPGPRPGQRGSSDLRLGDGVRSYVGRYVLAMQILGASW